MGIIKRYTTAIPTKSDWKMNRNMQVQNSSPVKKHFVFMFKDVAGVVSVKKDWNWKVILLIINFEK